MVKNKLISFIQILAHPLFIGFIVAYVVLEESHYSFFPDNIVRDYYWYIRENRNESMKDDLSYSYCFNEGYIEKPIIGYINDRYYIFSEKILGDYQGNDSIFLNRRDVFSYTCGIEPRIYFSSFNLYRKYTNNTFRNHCPYYAIQFVDSLYNMKFYKFRRLPESFLFMLENERSYAPILAGKFSDHPLISHTKEYYPTVAAVFKKKEVKKMYNKEYPIDSIKIIEEYYPWF